MLISEKGVVSLDLVLSEKGVVSWDLVVSEKGVVGFGSIRIPRICKFILFPKLLRLVAPGT